MDQKKSFLLNTLVFKGKPLSLANEKNVEIVKPETVGLKDTFYGGRVKNLAKVGEGLYFCMEDHKPIDVLVSDVTVLNYNNLREVARLKGHDTGNAKQAEILSTYFDIEIEQKGGDK